MPSSILPVHPNYTKFSEFVRIDNERAPDHAVKTNEGSLSDEIC